MNDGETNKALYHARLRGLFAGECFRVNWRPVFIEG